MGVWMVSLLNSPCQGLDYLCLDFIRIPCTLVHCSAICPLLSGDRRWALAERGPLALVCCICEGVLPTDFPSSFPHHLCFLPILTD